MVYLNHLVNKTVLLLEHFANIKSSLTEINHGQSNLSYIAPNIWNKLTHSLKLTKKVKHKS